MSTPKFKRIYTLVGWDSPEMHDRRRNWSDGMDHDTIAEAKKFAKYSLTQAYKDSGEMSGDMNVAQVWVIERDDKEYLHTEYRRKGWSPESL